MSRSYTKPVGTTFTLLSLAVLITFFSLRPWASKPVIDWDVSQYYAYLPALFIHHTFQFDDHTEEWTKAHFRLQRTGTPHGFIKMSGGLAYLYSPFFLLAHGYASLAGEPTHGFSPPYHFSVLFSAVVYGLLGLWLLGSVLQRFFSGPVVALSVPLLFFGTNLPYYTLAEPISHVYNFSLVCLLLYLFFGYLDRPGHGRAFFIGLAAGILVLIRPTDLIILLMPILYLAGRGKLPVGFIRHLALALLAALLVWLPQLFYWHWATGHWLVYSYGGESFFFLDPEIWKGLFSYRKGWLLYSPLLIFAFAGFFFLFKKEKKLSLAILITMGMGLWVTFSWWCWWYGGGFGARPLIDFLPLMAFGLAAMLSVVLKSRWFLKLPLLLVFGFLAFLSLFMNYQYSRGIIHHDAMGKELFWAQFLKAEYIKNYDELLDPPDYEKAMRNEEE